MTRVSTTGNYQSALLNLMNAQNQKNDAQTRVATQKNATDSAGFGRGAEILTALKASQARSQGFADTGEAVTARLESQDLALNQINDGIGSARSAVGNVLATGSADTLLLELEGNFQSVQNGLNGQHQGNYLFGGARSTQAPVKVNTLADLAAAPDVASTFGNDDLASVSRVSETNTIQTGYLADDVGSPIFQIFRDIKAYNDDPATGPLSGKINDTQKAFLTAQLSRLDSASSGVVQSIARNGSLQKQVETTTASNTAQAESIGTLIAGKTDADLAKAATDLQLSDLAVQASAKVISQLSSVSLLDYLR